MMLHGRPSLLRAKPLTAFPGPYFKKRRHARVDPLDGNHNLLDPMDCLLHLVDALVWPIGPYFGDVKRKLWALLRLIDGVSKWFLTQTMWPCVLLL